MSRRPIPGPLRGLGRWALGVLALSATSALATEAPKPPARPNLVLVIADDMGRQLGVYGDSAARTPALDRLAAEGVRFDRFYVAAPTCAPSRAAFLTGLFPHANGQWGFPGDSRLHRDVPTLPQRLRAAGYYTVLLGKLHVRGRGAQFPWDLARRLLGRNDQSPESVARNVDAAVKRAAGQPLFLVLSTQAPHTPYPGEEGEPPWPDPLDPAVVPVPETALDTPGYRASLARMYDAYALADAVIGAAVGALDAGQGRETLLVVTSDHGPSVPAGKGTLFEDGIRVPLLVRWPGVAAAGGVSQALVSGVDLMPTFLEAAGLVGREALHGRSFAPVLRDPSAAGHEAVFSEQILLQGGRYFPQRAVRSGPHKYVRNLRPDVELRNHPMDRWAMPYLLRWHTDPRARRLLERQVRPPREELYDLTADPAQLENLAADPAAAAVLARLRGELRSWMARTGDPWLALWDWREGQPDPHQPERDDDGSFQPRWLDAALEAIAQRLGTDASTAPSDAPSAGETPRPTSPGRE